MVSTETSHVAEPGRRRPRWLIVAGIIVVVSVIGGVAYAYWTTTGTGTGTATTGTSSSVVVTQTSAPTDLAPGVAAGPITGTITNNGTSNAHVATVTVAITSVNQGGNPAVGCDATDYTLTGAVMTVDQDVPAGGGTQAFSGATLGFNNKTTNQDACQGATVNLTYTVA
jgi:hypothetical protein